MERNVSLTFLKSNYPKPLEKSEPHDESIAKVFQFQNISDLPSSTLYVKYLAKPCKAAEHLPLK